VDLIELVRQLNEKPGKCSLGNNLRETIVAFDVPTIVSYSRELSPSDGTLVGEFLCYHAHSKTNLRIVKKC